VGKDDGETVMNALVGVVVWAVREIISELLGSLKRLAALAVVAAALAALAYALVYRLVAIMATGRHVGIAPNTSSRRSVNRAAFVLFMLALSIKCLDGGRTVFNAVCINLLAILGAKLAESPHRFLDALVRSRDRRR
jgi:hypothetical protein